MLSGSVFGHLSVVCILLSRNPFCLPIFTRGGLTTHGATGQ
ncbi:unnamed protein product [Staurois parvus]|uniref:Uncharacterized protein n=1 Tax=Staurois parvus TaxID=386267 RepID=A0ABN9DM67_9NEOB|nr:unnamed protein product [Staurois parvus]